MSESIDNDDLGRFGYAQELFRGMGGFSSFAISFSIISILTGAFTLYGYGLEMGGPLEITLGWPLATLGTLTVACSMAELCSAYPTAGGTYHWAAAFGGPAAGWFVAALNIIGLVAEQAGINYSCAQCLLPFLGVPSSAANLLVAFTAILATQAALNHWGVKAVAVLNDLSVTAHIAGVLILVAALFLFAPKQPASFLFQAVNSNGQRFYWWAFLLGLLLAQWTYTGFDASASLAEETHDPRRRAAWGIVLAVAVSGVVGSLLLLAITLAIRTIPGALHAVDAQGNSVPAVTAILQQALGARAGNALSAMAAMAMWFCGLSCIASTSRAIFALARDGGLPFSPQLRFVSPKHGTPSRAIWLTAALAFLTILANNAIPVITSVSTIALYLAYSLPVLLAYRARRAGSRWAESAVWSLGRFGPAINVAAIVYAAGICVILVMPPNAAAGETLLVLGALLAILFLTAIRTHYHGPQWAGHDS